jgi:3-dehydroquinate synthase class II
MEAELSSVKLTEAVTLRVGDRVCVISADLVTLDVAS